jgi:hypothetical protein
MRPLALSLVFLCPALSAHPRDCGSIVPSVCVQTVDDEAPRRKVLKVRSTVTPYVVGDRFPVETRSLLMDPVRYGLTPSDGSWRYYALRGVVYRVENRSGLVLEVIRSHRTSHLR